MALKTEFSPISFFNYIRFTNIYIRDTKLNYVRKIIMTDCKFLWIHRKFQTAKLHIMHIIQKSFKMHIQKCNAIENFLPNSFLYKFYKNINSTSKYKHLCRKYLL